VRQTAHYIREKDKETNETAPLTQMNCAVCRTLEDAIKAFLAVGYPVPVRAIARRFGVSKDKVARLARRLVAEPAQPNEPEPLPDQSELILEDAPTPVFCPECGEPLEPENGRAACVGCGRLWLVQQKSPPIRAEQGGAFR